MQLIAPKNQLDLENPNPRDFRIFKYQSWIFFIFKRYYFSEYFFSLIVSHSRFRHQNSIFLTDSEYLEQGHHFDYFWSNISFKIESYFGFLKFNKKKPIFSVKNSTFSSFWMRARDDSPSARGIRAEKITFIMYKHIMCLLKKKLSKQLL